MFKFSKSVQPDADELLFTLRRKGTPRRVHYMELFLDGEVQEAIVRRFDLTKGIRPDDPHFAEKRQIAIQRFLGYDHVGAALGVAMPTTHICAPDTAELARAGGRSFMEEHKGPITSWEDFEKYPWPDVAAASDQSLAWYEANLPDDMCVIASTGAHYCEFLCWLMGYETLCYALYDQRDLVEAICRKVHRINLAILDRLKQYRRIRAVWGSDDMGFKTQTLISPADTRAFVLTGHKASARIAHEHGWLYLLHACGNLSAVMDDLIDDVKIDAKHSFEDTIEPVADAKKRYGGKIALLGGIDVDFLCRGDENAIRRRVRRTVAACHPGGGYCLGTGNSVANYIPVDNYLVMLDEGRRA